MRQCTRRLTVPGVRCVPAHIGRQFEFDLSDLTVDQDLTQESF